MRQEAEAARLQLEEEQQATTDPARTVVQMEACTADAAHALQYATERHVELVSHVEEALDDETRAGAEFTCFTRTKARALLVQKHKY